MASKSTAPKIDPSEIARRRLRETDARVTDARVRTLAVLIEADEALTHADLQQRLMKPAGAAPLDRVTLYRVLDWLVDQGLAHRVAGPDQVWRYSAHSHADHVHGHFNCRRCERTFCIEEPAHLDRSVRSALPPGFRSEDVDFVVTGVCGTCAAAPSRR